MHLTNIISVLSVIWATKLILFTWVYVGYAHTIRMAIYSNACDLLMMKLYNLIKSHFDAENASVSTNPSQWKWHKLDAKIFHLPQTTIFLSIYLSHSPISQERIMGNFYAQSRNVSIAQFIEVFFPSCCCCFSLLLLYKFRSSCKALDQFYIEIPNHIIYTQPRHELIFSYAI